MYSVSVNLSFLAWHYLIGGDFGPENERNDHNYVVEAILEGPRLDEHGFLVDITAVRAALEDAEERYAGSTLNEFPEFEGIESKRRALCAHPLGVHNRAHFHGLADRPGRARLGGR